MAYLHSPDGFGGSFSQFKIGAGFEAGASPQGKADGGSSLNYGAGLPGGSGIASSVERAWCSFEMVYSAEYFSVQQRVTATFKQQDGRTLHVRKATVAKLGLKELYDALGISALPGGIQKLVV
jgi:hypothetical protein